MYATKIEGTRSAAPAPPPIAFPRTGSAPAPSLFPGGSGMGGILGVVGEQSEAPLCAADDREIIARVLRREPRAEAAFVFRYGRFVYGVLRHAGVSPCDADDLFQDVFHHLWENDCRRLRQWRAQNNARFTSFLWVVALHRVHDRWRSEKSHPPRATALTTAAPLGEGGVPASSSAALSPGGDLTTLCHRRQQVAAILKVLPKLRERDAALIRARHLQGLSYAQIADTLVLPPAQIGAMLSRAEKRLRTGLSRTCADLFDEEIGTCHP